MLQYNMILTSKQTQQNRTKVMNRRKKKKGPRKGT